jgi:hypothetical protein
MTWQDILKATNLRVGSKVTTNVGSSSNTEPDEPCKKKLLEYMEKMKTRKGILTNLDKESSIFETREGERESKFGGIIHEEVEHYMLKQSNASQTDGVELSFSALPEDVACKALKMFSGMSGNATILKKQIGDNYWCEVTRLIMPKNRVYSLSDMQYMFFEIGLTIMMFNDDGQVVLDFAHRLYLPFDEVRSKIKEYDLLLDNMDWR